MPDTPDSKDRRKDPRVELRAEAEVAFASWDIFKLIYTINISKGGMRLALPKAPELGSKLTIKFALPAGETIALEGIVRHVVDMKKKDSKACEVGVEFENLDAKKRADIERAIAAHSMRL